MDYKNTADTMKASAVTPGRAQKAPHEEGREGSGYAGTYYGIWNYCDCSF